MKNTFIVLLLLACCHPLQASEKKHMVAAGRTGCLMLGVGKANVTPQAELLPFHAQHEAYPYVNIHDSLYTRALVMDNGMKRAVFIELDEVAVPDHQAIYADVAHQAGVAVSDVVICVSHTHSTLHPNKQDERLQPVTDKIKQGIATAVKQALGSLQPATVAFTRTQAYVNVNSGEAVQSIAHYNPEGFSDKTLDIIRFCKTDGSPLALILNYETHAEVMFRSLSRHDGYEISGDLPGRVAYLLEHEAKAYPVVLTTAGAEADQQAYFNSKVYTSDGKVIDEGAGGWAIMDVQAHRLVDAVNKAVQTMEAGESQVTLTTAFAEARVPGQKVSLDRANGKVTIAPTADVLIPVTTIRLNEIAIGAVGADLASAIGADIRKASPYKYTMLVTMTGGAVGYVLTDETYRNPVHGVLGSRVKPGYAKDAIIDTFKRINQ